MQLFDPNHNRIYLDQKLGWGGEAEIYSVRNSASHVAKMYTVHSGEREAKLRRMISAPPTDPTESQGHVSICWPQTLIFDPQNVCVGFLMHRMDFKTSVPVLVLVNPQDRQRLAPGFTWGYLVRVATNIASVVEAIHLGGYVIGDLNESNFLVSNRALVTLVDCDSIQVQDEAGHYYRCPVGKSDFTAPELQGRDFRQIDRSTMHDNFGLGVMIFQLLMEGIHPYSGVWHGIGESPSLEARIERGDCCYVGSSIVSPMPSALPYDFLPSTIQALIGRCFGLGHRITSERPSPKDWRVALENLEHNVRECTATKLHVYPTHHTKCPWCERAKLFGGFDPFLPASSQRPLAATTFHRTPLMPQFGVGATPLAPQAIATVPVTITGQGVGRNRLSRGWSIALGAIAGVFFYVVLVSALSVITAARGVQSSTARFIICDVLVLLCSVFIGVSITKVLGTNLVHGGKYVLGGAITAILPFLIVLTVGARRPVNYPRIDGLEGESIGVSSGLTWDHAIGNRGASFSAAESSRIQYPNVIPAEGTLEFWINVRDGYRYDNYRLLRNQDDAMIFSSDAQGGDVTWPGTTKIFVSREGKISFWMATSKYDRPKAFATEAVDTSFRFGEWHALGFSFGSQGQYIMLDGKVVASAPERTQTFGVAGNRNHPLDVPTIGETLSHFWPYHRYEGGFEGTLGEFRISAKQQDWQLAEGVVGVTTPTVAGASPVSEEDQREHELVSQAQQLFAAHSYEAALAACNEALILNAGDRTATKLRQNIESALTSANAPVQAAANPTMNSASSSPPATINGPELALKGSSSVPGTAKDVNGITSTKSQPATDINPIQPRSETNALELLAQVQSAMGGRDRLAEIRDWQRQESETWLPGRGTTQQTVSFVEPSTIRVEAKGGNRVVNFSNGKSGWTWSSTTGPARNLPSLTATGMAFRTLPDLMLSDTKPGRTVRLLSPGVLGISDDDHDSAKVTIDLNSHLPQKVSWTNLDGATLEETFSNWRTVNGTLWWFDMTRSRDGAVFLLDKVREYRVNSGVTEQVLATQPDRTRRSYVPSSSLSTGQPMVMHTDADRRGTLTLLDDHIEYRDEGMGTDGGRAPYGPNPANNFSLSCSEIENLKSYGFRPIVFGSFQVVISAHKKKFHIPALHGDSVVKAIRQECGLLSSERH